MSSLYISQQTEAEKDNYLLDCFHDSGAIAKLVNSSYTSLSGRKGSGKSALAIYLEKNSSNYGVDLVNRVSIRSFNTLKTGSQNQTLDSILYFLIIKTVQRLLSSGCLDDNKSAEKYWKDFLETNGLQQISDYRSFVETRKTKKTGFSVKAIASYIPFAKGEASGDKSHSTEKEKAAISDSPSSLFESLRQSIPENISIIFFIDDISDYLDESDKESLRADINVVKDLLLQLQAYNLSFVESGINFRYVSLVRDDLFDYMQGSNIGKIKSDSLALEWDEKSFASLLIRRMKYFQNNLDQALEDPVASIKSRFPDEIFSETLEMFSTNRYGSNFYAYMAAISFNRPRDFLQFCYALRNRLSNNRPASFENIESAEIEYTDYFRQELRDELYVASRIFDYDFSEERLNQLVDIMSRNDSFNMSQLRSELGKFLGEKTSIGRKKIETLVTELWRYGIVGVSEKEDKIIRFKYLNDSAVFTKEKIKKYTFHLHRGLWWFARKRN